MSENKLKTCPFCGGEAELVIAPSNQYMGIPCYAIACKHCKVMMGTVQEGRTDFYRTPQEAIKAWNTRKPMERIVEQLNKRIEDAGKIMVENPADKLDEIANNAAEDFIQAYEECIELIEKDGAE